MMDYKEGLRQLLIGLECQEVDRFVDICTPKDCRHMGEMYALTVKGELATQKAKDLFSAKLENE